MTYPTKYTRQYDFLAYQNANPTRPLPGQKINVDYDAVEQSIDEIVEFLKTSLRSDGAIVNGSVSRDQLSDDILALIDAANGDEIVASQVTYDNTLSGLSATTVQEAIDELGTAAVTSVFGRSGAVVAVAGDYDAEEIDYDPTASGLTATDVKAALDELAGTAASSISLGVFSYWLAN